MRTIQSIVMRPIRFLGIGLAMLSVAAIGLAAIDTTTHILIDGDSSDWDAYAVPQMDPHGDALGVIDIIGVAALYNDESVYVLVLMEGDTSQIAQIDFDFNADPFGAPLVRASLKPWQNEFHVTRQIDGVPLELESTGVFQLAESAELRLPLSSFDGVAPTTVSIRLIDRDHGKKSPADVTADCSILAISGLDLPLQAQANLTGSDSMFCQCPSTNHSFAAAPGILVPSGYSAEYFIAPSGLNTPSDVAVLPDGQIFVTSSRGGVVQQVFADGRLETFAEGHVYSIDYDSEGTLYGYNFPTGEVFLIEPNRMRRIARIADTACECTLAVAPDGTIYVGHNACSGDTSGQSTLYRISPDGDQATPMTTQLQGISALDVDRHGTLYAVAGGVLWTVNPVSGSIAMKADLAVAPSFHGLTVADNGDIYISSGDFRDQGGIYRIAEDGTATEIAHFSGNGIEGIAITPDGAIIGTQRSVGGLQHVSADGTITALIEPNGLVSPHSLAFSPCGELVTVNDEGGRLTIACPNGENRPLMSLVSFQPPQTHIAFSTEGWFVCGESAPGFPSLLNLYLPNGSSQTLATDLDNVSGVAVGADGVIYAAATGDGTIVRIQPDGTRELIAQGLETPQALAVASDGTVYAVVGGAGFGDVFAIPAFGDAVIAISPDGMIRKLAQIDGAAALAVGPDGLLYVAAGRVVMVIDEWGTAWPFAQGFQFARGLAFDAEGRLYVADDDGNAIVRIVPRP
mgnify:CR=1 FL=1